MLRLLILWGCLTFILGSCSRPLHPTLVGQWEGQDSAGNNIAIAFTPDGEYHLSVNENHLIGSSDNKPLQYQILTSSRKRAEVMLFENKTDLIQGYQSIIHADFLSGNTIELRPQQKNTADDQPLFLVRE
ncbi:MAG: hypothetical protein HRU40_15025 [Saprospiraceae bacterium]|nr:hypothetical protein [Saprospiraceae bacterium]